jgi:hypothetical protein
MSKGVEVDGTEWRVCQHSQWDIDFKDCVYYDTR